VNKICSSQKPELGYVVKISRRTSFTTKKHYAIRKSESKARVAIKAAAGVACAPSFNSLVNLSHYMAGKRATLSN
jgi:hypothetical protein